MFSRGCSKLIPTAAARFPRNHLTVVIESSIILGFSSKARKQVTQKAAAMKSEQKAEYDARWENLWSAGLKPGDAFDEQKSSPSLLDLIKNHKDLIDVTNKRCFIPGCGRGYDVETLIRLGAASAIGLELAQTAAEAARAYLDTAFNSTEAEQTLKLKTQVITGDFYQWSQDDQGFDIGYDYTFMCAMHPDMRDDWAAAWSRHLVPGGKLITLIFPIEEEGREGPPWPVKPEIYEALLTKNGFELVHMEALAADLSHPSRVGRESMAVWLKK